MSRVRGHHYPASRRAGADKSAGHLPRSEHLPPLRALIGPGFIEELFAPHDG